MRSVSINAHPFWRSGSSRSRCSTTQVKAISDPAPPPSVARYQEAQTCPIRSYPARSRSAIGRRQLVMSEHSSRLAYGSWEWHHHGATPLGPETNTRIICPSKVSARTLLPALNTHLVASNRVGVVHACLKMLSQDLKRATAPPQTKHAPPNRHPQGAWEPARRARSRRRALSRDQTTWHAWSNTYVGPWATYRLLICGDRRMTKA